MYKSKCNKTYTIDTIKLGRLRVPARHCHDALPARPAPPLVGPHCCCRWLLLLLLLCRWLRLHSPVPSLPYHDSLAIHLDNCNNRGRERSSPKPFRTLQHTSFKLASLILANLNAVWGPYVPRPPQPSSQSPLPFQPTCHTTHRAVQCGYELLVGGVPA